MTILTISAQRQLAPRIFEMTLQGELVRDLKKPGQFLHIRVPNNTMLLRRPISLAEINPDYCKIIYRIEGAGTEIFSKMKAGEQLDVIGPLGNGYDVTELAAGQLAFVIGGGIGTPPMYELSKQLLARGVRVVQLLGYASKEVIFYEKEFLQLSRETRYATDDGSYGLHGHMGMLIDAALEEFGQPDAVYACGANGLLKAVDRKFADHPRAYISMEARMACGIGACYACVIHTTSDNNSSLKVCDQGPIFATGKVVI